MTDQDLFDKAFVGYDGSNSSHHIITVFSRLHPKLKTTTFAFVWDPLKNYIPMTARGPGIEKEIRQKTEGHDNVEIKIIGK